ncbi:hypothetical protein B0T17DRAFT_463109, partial [Bombardia bombarda]
SSSKKRKTAITEIEVDLTQPEPPSKKAKRLLKKGKTLPAKANSDDDDGDDKAGKSEDAKKKKERSPYGVWIGNLRFTVTKKELREWFVENSGGSITDEMITRVHMPMTKPVNGGPKKTTPENRGFAYVDFATLDANVAAIALSETEWYRRKVLIKDSKSYEGRPDKVEVDAKADEEGADGAKGTEVKKNPSTKVFVGNLSFTTTEDDLHAHFEKCGKIRWIKVATFEDTGKCKGYGWVNFEEAEAAEWAVKGFVKVRETIDTLEDFMDVDEDANENSDAEDDDATKAKKAKAAKKAAEKEPPRIKTRKWWVNQLLGRNLKIELAEDDQTRYTKRFKKGGSHNKKDQEAAEQQADRTAPPVRKPYVKEKKPINFATDISVARLTGAPVAHQGKKTTFE